MIEILIKMDEKDYKRILAIPDVSKSLAPRAYSAIRNGTPLPKGHGRIIDESQISRIEVHTERELYGDKIRYVKVTDAPTIIEKE